MTKQVVNVGVLPNDGQGDNLRAGATKINNNFTELYTALGDGDQLTVVVNNVLNSFPPTSDGSNKITFLFDEYSDLPNPTTYDGMLAKVTADACVYYAHDNSWRKVLDQSSTLDQLSDIASATPSDGQALVWNASNNEWAPGNVATEGGSSAFTALTDTPGAYTGSNGRLLRVNSAGNGLEFSSAITSAEVATIPVGALSNVSSSAPGTGDVLKWDGAQWAPGADIASGGSGLDADTLDGFDSAYFLDYTNFTNTPTLFGGAFTNLTDTPSAFTGAANRFVKVNSAGDGLEFVVDQSTDQNLWETIAADTGSTSASTLTDTLTIAGGTDIATEITDGTLTINFNGALGAQALNELSDVSTANAVIGAAVAYNGTSWAPQNGASITWTIGANGTSDYTFTGPGFPTTTNDPALYLMRGMTYYFVNNSGGSHPFEIRVADGGVAYSSGVANNNASTGVITFTVPMNAPATLYYQCSAHSNMGNTINIVS
jgi:hypothetical protein